MPVSKVSAPTPLANFLSKLVLAEGARDEEGAEQELASHGHSCGVSYDEKQVDENTSVLKILLVVFVAGCVVSWFAGCWCARMASPKKTTREVETQSQVTYRRDLQTARFQPLGERQ